MRAAYFDTYRSIALIETMNNWELGYICTCCRLGWLLSVNHFCRRGISVSGSKQTRILGFCTRYAEFGTEDLCSVDIVDVLGRSSSEVWKRTAKNDIFHFGGLHWLEFEVYFAKWLQYWRKSLIGNCRYQRALFNWYVFLLRLPT